jgi:hypothetical protein
MSIISRIGLFAVAGAAFLCFQASPAEAQATRTWVSGVGDDANPCSRTAPCKTFAGAISKTAAGGEINCLDPGGFGAVTITKAMTISCQYTEGGALAGGNGIVVNAGPTDAVYIRGLDIFGVNPPTNGIRFVAGGSLHIEDCVIRRFNAANSFGISFAPGAASRLYITNTLIADNGNGATGGGILIDPGAAGNARVSISNVRVLNNANEGIFVDMTGSTGGGVHVTIDDSLLAGNVNGLRVLVPAGAHGTTVTLADSTVVNNTGTGLITDGSLATMLVSNTTISGNNNGVSRLNASNMRTYGDNRLHGSLSVDGTFTPPIVAKE